MKRSSAFLGIHFDFHATEQDKAIGLTVTREMIKEIIELVRPDYIQCDCKGHPGFSSYPTEIGHAAPGIEADMLRVWRDVTQEYGVALCMHYSGVYDTEAIKRNPAWARINEDGTPDRNSTSTMSSYVDELLIPQLKELSDKYGVDAIWLDGECWAVGREYGADFVQAFTAETGIQEIPQKPEDPYYVKFSEFCREAFRRYLRHYVQELHAYNSNMEIASNWAFSSFMPEPVSAEVDFLSGDYTLQNSVNAARFEGRFLMRQGKPWDLMAWGFGGLFGSSTLPHDFTTKMPAQLKQEAAIVLALGGGFQTYFQQKRDGSIHRWELQLMKEVAEFARARQPWCHRGEAVRQVALLYSKAAFYSKTQGLFNSQEGTLIPLRGVLQALLENQQIVDVVAEHQLTGQMEEYGLIVIPEWVDIEPEFREELLSYVRNGGRLIVIGAEAVAPFEEELGVQFPEEPIDSKRYLQHEEWFAGLTTTCRRALPQAQTEAYGYSYEGNEPSGDAWPAGTIATYGNGLMAGIYFNFGERYLNACTATQRKFLGSLTRHLFPESLVEVKGSMFVDIVATRKNNALLLHLVNTSGPHADTKQYSFDEVPPIGRLEVSVRTAKKPQSVTLQPYGTSLPYRYEDNKLIFELKQLEFYDIVEIKES